MRFESPSRPRPGFANARVVAETDRVAARLRNAAVVCGIIAGLVGVVVLVGGWWLDISVLRQPLPAYTSMRAAAALGLIASGAGIVTVGLRGPRWLIGSCGGVATAVGGVAMTAYLLGAPRSILESLIAIDLARDLSVPGRVSISAALCLLLLGASLILLSFRVADGVRQALGLGVVGFAYFTLIGHLISGAAVADRLPPEVTAAAPHTALVLLMAGFGVVFVSLDRGWGRIFAEPLAGGTTLRTLLPAALTLVLSFAVLRGAYSDVNVLEETVGLSVLAVAMIIGLLFVARRIQRIDEERSSLAADIEAGILGETLDPRQTAALLRTQFDRAPSGMALIGRDGLTLNVNAALSTITGYPIERLVRIELLSLVVHPDDRDLANSFLADDACGVEDGRRIEVRLARAGGGIAWGRLSVGAVRDESNRPIVYILNIEDITDEVVARAALAESEQRYRLVADSSTDAVLLIGLDGVIQWAAPSIKSVFGYEVQQLVGQDSTTLIHPDDVAQLRRVRQEAAESDRGVAFELRFRGADGVYRWVAGKTGAARDPKGILVGRLTTFHDIQEQVETRRALEHSEHLFRRAMDAAPRGLAIVALDNRFTQVNEALCQLLDRDEAWLLVHSITDVVDPEDRGIDEEERQQLRDSRAERLVRERRWVRADGTRIWVIHSTSLLRDADGSPISYVCHIQDNTVAHRARDELVRRASHDLLTGLMNGDALLQHVTDLLARRSELGFTRGLLFCDVDHFKAINDRYGHAAGDEVLRLSAKRMAAALRGDDLAARLGGDEFVVVLADVADQAAALGVAEKIRRAVSSPVHLGAEGFVSVTMSIGIALAAPEMSAHRLLRNADAALYQAKRAGRDRVSILDDVAVARAEIDVRDGLAARQFVPWFQPIVNLATGELAGYEALARRVRPDGSINLPENFIVDAERSHLIGGLDIAVLRASLDRLARLAPPLYVAVNVSPTTLASVENTRHMIEAIDESGVDPTRLHLELSEAALLGTSDIVREAMCDLAAFGARWYVDDFGTGYSSISHLRDLPISGLKLDQSFTAGVGSGDVRGEQLSQALASLAASLGLDSVAEGVQTVAQAETLRAEGWRHGQGWLFGRPMPAATPNRAA